MKYEQQKWNQRKPLFEGMLWSDVFFCSRSSTKYVPDEFRSFPEVLGMFVVAGHVGDCFFSIWVME